MHSLKEKSFSIIRDDDDQSEDMISDTRHTINMNTQNNLIQALYGSHEHTVDVTDIIKHLKIPYFQVTNQLFTDPCVGQIKSLILIFNDGCQKIYKEGCFVDSRTHEIYKKKLLKATYGYQDVYLDVTDIVRQQNKEFRVCNNMFTDPCPGYVKSLIITFENDQISCPEHSLVNPNLWTCSQADTITHIYM